MAGIGLGPGLSHGRYPGLAVYEFYFSAKLNMKRKIKKKKSKRVKSNFPKCPDCGGRTYPRMGGVYSRVLLLV